VVGRTDVSPDILEKVKEFVKKKYGAKEVEINIEIDEKIKGGIIIKVGDEILDGSVSSQLKRLKNILSK
jgi:F-type H+-transporting ATPase subunit delta